MKGQRIPLQPDTTFSLLRSERGEVCGARLDASWTTEVDLTSSFTSDDSSDWRWSDDEGGRVGSRVSSQDSVLTCDQLLLFLLQVIMKFLLINDVSDQPQQKERVSVHPTGQ